MFYLATVLLLRVIDVSVESISEPRGRHHHQLTDCTLLWRNSNYSSSTSLFFSSCSFTAGYAIVQLHVELTDSPPSPCHCGSVTPSCGGSGEGGSLFSALLLTHNNFQLVLICIPYYHFRCCVVGGGDCLHLHTLSYLAELSMQGLCSFFKNKYSIPIARSLCSPLLLHLDKCLSASVDHLLMETSWLYAWFTDRYSGYSVLLRVMINLYSTLIQNLTFVSFQIIN